MSVHFLRATVHTLPDSFCADMKAFLDRVSVNDDFRAISVTEPKLAALISKVESHISGRCSKYTG